METAAFAMGARTPPAATAIQRGRTQLSQINERARIVLRDVTGA